MKQRVSEVYPELSQTSKMELFAKIVNGLNLLIIFVKSSILVVRLCSEYASEFSYKQSLYWRGTNILLVTACVVHSESLKLPMKQFIFSKVADCSPATLLNLNTCTIFRTCYSVPEADLVLPQLFKWNSLWTESLKLLVAESRQLMRLRTSS